MQSISLQELPIFFYISFISNYIKKVAIQVCGDSFHQINGMNMNQ